MESSSLQESLLPLQFHGMAILPRSHPKQPLKIMRASFFARFAVSLVLFFTPAAFADGVSNICPHWPWESGTCVIDTPIYINVYWDASPQQWDIDVGASGETQARLDEVLEAMIHSDYYTQLQQYQVWSVSSVPSMTVSCIPPPAAWTASRIR
jgi:hypothetical protein